MFISNSQTDERVATNFTYANFVTEFFFRSIWKSLKLYINCYSRAVRYNSRFFTSISFILIVFLNIFLKYRSLQNPSWCFTNLLFLVLICQDKLSISTNCQLLRNFFYVSVFFQNVNYLTFIFWSISLLQH